MPAPAPERSSAAGPVLLVLLALGGCGNRGELYLESPPDVNDALRALDPEAEPAADPSPLPPGDGIAPTLAPEPDPENDPEADPDESDEDVDEEDVNEGRDSGAKGSGS